MITKNENLQCADDVNMTWSEVKFVWEHASRVAETESVRTLSVLTDVRITLAKVRENISGFRRDKQMYP